MLTNPITNYQIWYWKHYRTELWSQ